MTSSILVTGGTGTLGRLVVKHLRDAGSDLRVLTRKSRDPEPGLAFIAGDLLTGAGVDEAVQGSRRSSTAPGTSKATRR
jgi:nucleoside-diphosphate-sugar epimerase